MTNIKNTSLKRLFFAFKVNMPWPSPLPHARLLDENVRHMTVAFLGQTDFSKLEPLLSTLPLPIFKVGQTGATDQILFLPERHPHVVAWHASDGNQMYSLANYAQQLIEWLLQHDFSPDTRHPFLPHITLGRAPFDRHAWQKAFVPLPLVVDSLHLFESQGQLHYQPVWSQFFKEPFLEIEHTADIAFHIRGESITQLFNNALTALAFKYPILLKFNSEASQISDIDDIIMALNRIISLADSVVGCPFKAISYHGEIEKEADGVLHWEMIVDV
jgi:2'-5' RNA ligase